MRATYRLVFNYGVVTMKSNRTIRFACDSCGKKFQAEPDRITESDVRSAHPWDYFALCPDCGKEAPQIWWEKNIFRAWHKATGPKTTEGKKRSRLNALTHGLRAQTLSFFPARPGQYPHCKGCSYLNGVQPGEEQSCQQWAIKKAFITYEIPLVSEWKQQVYHNGIERRFWDMLSTMLQRFIHRLAW